MEYVMKDIDDGQTSLFDTAQSRQNAAPPVEQEPPQLPEGIVDVDYTVISDDKGYILRNPDKCGIKDQWGILKVLVGERMTVSRSAGHCYAETADGIIALGSAYLAEDPRHVDDSILEPHLAEEIACKTVTTGASNDIEQATKLARAMITRYGMSRDFDMVAMETVQNQYLGGDTSLACSAETQAKIDQQVVALVKQQHEKALKLLTDNRAKLDELAAFLYEKETITGEEFMEILNKK